MIGLGAATRVYLAVGVTDMRKSFDGLYGLARDQLAVDPLSGHLFVFCNRQRNRLKVLYWDGSGLWVCSKRLERGRFSWPQAEEEKVRIQLSQAELNLLLNGIELGRARAKTWYRPEKMELISTKN
jgi:transposase